MSASSHTALHLPDAATSRPFSHGARRLLPGLLLAGTLAGAAMALSQWSWLQSNGVSTLTLAMVLGMVFGNTVYPLQAAGVASNSEPGVNLAKQTVLRLGVALYGLRLTIQDIAHVGVAGVAIDALVLTSTFALATFVGTRWLGLDRKTAMLIGVGSSICGAAAVMAAEPVVRARAEQVTVAVATVVVFGTLAIFLYPVLFHLNQDWQIVPGGAKGFGIYIGSTLHEVAQVVAAAASVGAQAADTAVIAKMVRVMMLAPFLIALSAWLSWDASRSAGEWPNGSPAHRGRKVPLAVPWFAFGFIGIVLLNSLLTLPAGVRGAATGLDSVLLAMAMAALGLATPLSSIRKAGIRPLLLALGLFVWLIAGGALINCWVPKLIALS
jgi:uncharacterized integral membrane protein (TIGR00698 family)